MSDPVSQADELRSLEQKRLTAGLSPEEEARRAALAGSSLHGFDVNAAAAKLRAALDSAAGAAEVVPGSPPPASWSGELGQGWGLGGEQVAEQRTDERLVEPQDQAQEPGMEQAHGHAMGTAPESEEAVPTSAVTYTAADYGLDPSDPEAVAWASWYAAQGWDPATAYAYAERMNADLAGAAPSFPPCSETDALEAPGAAPVPELPVADAEPGLGAEESAPGPAAAPWADQQLEVPSEAAEPAAGYETAGSEPAPWGAALDGAALDAPQDSHEAAESAPEPSEEFPATLPRGVSLWEMITGSPRPADIPDPLAPSPDQPAPAEFHPEAGTMLLLDHMEPASGGSFGDGADGEQMAETPPAVAADELAGPGTVGADVALGDAGSAAEEAPAAPSVEEPSASAWQVKEQEQERPADAVADATAGVAVAAPEPPGPWDVRAEPAELPEAELVEIADDDIIELEAAESAPTPPSIPYGSPLAEGAALDEPAPPELTPPLEPAPAAPAEPPAPHELSPLDRLEALVARQLAPLSAAPEAPLVALDSGGPEPTETFALHPAEGAESHEDSAPSLESEPASSLELPEPATALSGAAPADSAPLASEQGESAPERPDAGAPTPEPTLTFLRVSNRESTGGWESPSADAEPARLVPERTAPVLDASFDAHDAEPVQEPEAPPPELSPDCFVAGSHRVVVHTADGQVRRGTVSDVALDGEVVLLAPPAGGTREPVPTEQIRAIFFMLPLGDKPAPPEGKKVRVTFRDGRQVAGFSPDYDPDRKGFFMIPADTRTHTARIWVYRTAVRQVWVG